MKNCSLTIGGLADTSVWKGIKSKFLHMAFNVADTALQQYKFTIYFILPRSDVKWEVVIKTEQKGTKIAQLLTEGVWTLN